jgi:ATP synthase, F1 epsilon subunit (delta in mitochondria)
MTGKEFDLEIVTPKRVVFNAQVNSFSAPGAMGGFQVLHSHAPLLSNLTIGEVKVIDVEGKEIHYATSGGFVEVRNNKVVMLADTAERSDEIDVERAKASVTRARERISTRQDGVDIERARVSLLRALNRLKVSGSQ